MKYRPALDGLRGVAVLIVMAYHAGLVTGGYIGVDVFFVLSGYLITTLLIQEWNARGSVSLTCFYARRGLRLLPALVAFLFVLLAMPHFFGATPVSSALIVLFYAANWVSALRLVDLGTLSHTWSLAIEEQFYALWPPLLVLLLALRIRFRWILAAVTLGVVAANALRLFLWDPARPELWTRVYFGLDTRMDAVLMGCLVALLIASGRLPRRILRGTAFTITSVAAAVALAAVTLAAPSRGSGAMYSHVELLVCVSAAVLLVQLLASPTCLAARLLENPELVWVGRISYGLYLWHVPVFHGLLNAERMFRWGVEGIRLQLLRFAVSLAIAAASFYLIERPLLRFKDRFRPLGNSSREPMPAV